MDIWSWVYTHVKEVREQDPELADQLLDLSEWTCDGLHGRLDAALPAVVARVRALKRPWLEVYARHWGLQSRILHRQDARFDALRDAVDLVERAHRPDAEDCPQSVCATQDLCAAYGVLDGAGHAEARIAAATETLDRIDANWPCFQCIHGELTSALLDKGAYDEALAQIDAAEQAIREVGAHGDLKRSRSETLICLGRPGDALEVIRAYDPGGAGASGQLSKSLRIAHALVRLGRIEDALTELPSAADLGDEVEHFVEWMQVMRLLVADHGRELEPPLVQAVNAMLHKLSLHCAHRDTLTHAAAWAELALDEGSWAYALAWYELAERHLPELVAPLGADERLRKIDERLDATRPAPFGEDAPSAVAALHAAVEAGRVSFSTLVATAIQLSGAIDVVNATAERWLFLGWPGRSAAVVDRALEVTPDPALIALRLRSLFHAGEGPPLVAELNRWAEHPAGRVQIDVAWFRSQLAEREKRYDDAAEAMAHAWTNLREHAGPGILRRQAAMLQLAGRLEDTARALDEVVALPEASPQDHLFRMEINTQLERWPAVRASAEAYGLELTGDGFIDDNFGSIGLEIDHQRYWATRIGPCHARIHQISGPGIEPELYGSVWAFDPFTGGGDDNAPFTAHGCLKPGGFAAVALDGVRLTDAQLEPISGVVTAANGGMYRSSSDEYQITDPDKDAIVDASWVKIALPVDSPHWPALAEACATLAQDHHPLVWHELLDRLDRPEEAEAHRQIAHDWGM